MRRGLRYITGMTLTVSMAILAAGVGLNLWHFYVEAPWTRDGRVRADVVALAPDVSGLITEVLVEDNDLVKRGALLFRIDPERFTIALRQAEAVVENKKASYEVAALDAARYSKLTDISVSQQKLELVRAAAQQSKALYDQAVADRDLAKLNLDRSSVRASVDGRITNMDLRPGIYATAGHGTLALIDTDTLRVEGYFEETKLQHIHNGDPATVHLMGYDETIEGRVESIAGGIEDRERVTGGNLMANVNPTFSWVRLAQRVPVRIAIEDKQLRAKLLVGLTASVTVHPYSHRSREYDLVWGELSFEMSSFLTQAYLFTINFTKYLRTIF